MTADILKTLLLRLQHQYLMEQLQTDIVAELL